MQKTLGKVMLGVVVLAAVIGAGLLLGGQAAHYATAKKQLAARNENTAGILSQMNTINVGDVLPDHRFEDLESNLVWLSDLLAHKTLISFYYPDCDGCILELEQLQNVCRDSADYQYFIYISSTDLQSLVEDREKHGIPLRIFYDHERAFAKELEVYTYPFNIIVNRDGLIEAIVGGALEESDFEDIIESNKVAGAGQS